MDAIQTLEFVPSPVGDVWRISDTIYRVRVGAKYWIVEQGRIIVRRTGRLRHLARYLVGWVGGIRTEVFLGFLSDAESLDWANQHVEPARAALHSQLDRLVDGEGVRVVSRVLDAIEGVLDKVTKVANAVERHVNRILDGVLEAVERSADGMMAAVERNVNPVFTLLDGLLA